MKEQVSEVQSFADLEIGRLVFSRLFYIRGSLRIRYELGVLKNFANSTGEHLCWSLLLIKLKTDYKTGVFL